MKVYSFPTRVAGTNIFVSHINDIQSAINYLSTELTNGIGSVDTPRVFKVAAAATGYASFNVPPAGGTPSAPASGDLWNDAGTLKFYNGTATKSVAFTDTVGGGSGDVSSNTSTSVDSEVVLFSGTGGKTVKRAAISGLAKLTSGVLSAATAGTDYAAAAHTHAISDVTGLQTALDLKAALASPTFTGTPAAPTAAVDTNTTQIATTAYVVGQGYLKSATASSTYAALSHSHAISDVTNLQTSLDGKAATSHTHAASDVTSGTFNIARIPTGTTSSTVSLGDHLHSGVYEPAFTTLSIAKGGTGQTTATAAINALLPSQTSNSGKYLTTDGTNTSWATVSGGGGATTLDGLSDVTAPSPSTGEYLRWNGSAWVDAYITGAWTVTFGDGTNAIATGYQIPVVYVPYDHVVTAHTILVPSGTTAVTGSLAVAVNRQPIANYPGSTNLSTIFTPTLSTQSIVTTTGLSTAVSAGIYRFNVTTATPTLTKVAIIFEFYRTT